MKERFKQFSQRLKYVKVNDILSAFTMVLAYIVSLLTRISHRNVWLICERKDEARDNGYWFYKYVCENHPEVEAIYAINKKAPDYGKVKELGRVIQFGSFLHWVYYFVSKRNISSQKEGKPNAALCYLLEVYLGFRKNRAYIRHGICKDDQQWVYYNVTKMNLFACSANREFEFVKERFGYPYGSVKLLGLCRFDNLLSHHDVKRQILVMPTMREWLRNVSIDTEKYEGHLDISKSEFFVTWNKLLSNKELASLLDNYDVNLIFYPHASFQKYISLFRTDCIRIHIANSSEYDVQSLLMESSVLITDYSSIYFDFAYMVKPLVYYQFDYDKYRAGQYQEGYFSYHNDGFGPVVETENSLLDELKKILDDGLRMQEQYRNRIENFYAFHDNNNCERTYFAVKEMCK